MTPATEAAAGLRPRVLVVDADPALAALLVEWLEEYGCVVDSEPAADEVPRARFDLLVVDVPFARHEGLARLRRVALRHPETPIVALSSSFFAGVDCTGVVARSLGAASVLPKPLAREALIAAVRRLLPRAA